MGRTVKVLKRSVNILVIFMKSVIVNLILFIYFYENSSEHLLVLITY